MKPTSFKSGIGLLVALLLAGSCKTDHGKQMNQHCLNQLPELKTTESKYSFREATNGDKLRSTVLEFSATDIGILEQSLAGAGYQSGPMPDAAASRLQAVGVRPENYYYKIVKESDQEMSVCVMNAGLDEVGFYRVKK